MKGRSQFDCFWKWEPATSTKKNFSFLFGSENLLYGIVCRLVSDCLVSSARS